MFFEKINEYVCYHTVLTTALTYGIVRWVPGPRMISDAIPFPGFGQGITLGEALISMLIAKAISAPISKQLCSASEKA